jgi:Thermolysin metallopeptidase, alpha-helical domain
MKAQPKRSTVMILYRLLAATAAALVAVALSSSPAAARGWTQQLDLDLSARELGLPLGAAAPRLARAALERSARRLGLPRSSGLRLASRARPPRSNGGRALRMLRFHQTVSGLRVVWSQIDVTVAAGEVSSIGATVVPVTSHALPDERRVSRARALRIARRAAPRGEAVLRPLPAAYAGSPGGRGRRTRSVWVVELELPTGDGGDAQSAVCIVVDARTGKVIARWRGIADRPDRGPDARGATAPAASLAVAAAPADFDPRTRASRPLVVVDGTGKDNPPPTSADVYAEFRTTGNTRLRSSWPPAPDARDPLAEPSDDMDALTVNAASVARELCVVRGWCGREGAWQPGALRVFPWIVIGNTTGISRVGSNLNVWINHDHIAPGTGVRTGRPDLAFNDVIAHEFGHIIDFIYAGDRVTSGAPLETDSLEEALADMFAYDFDREDATIAEEVVGDGRDWEVPGRLSRGDPPQPYPAHMRDYDTTPPLDARGNPSAHFNSTILSHAYFEFVQRIGHAKAGRVLHNVPATLSPRPTFKEVARGFVGRAGDIYPQDGLDAGTRSDAREAAEQAFDLVGISIRDHRGEQPG